MTYSILRYGFLVEGTNWSTSSKYRVETLFTEEVSTFCLNWVPHRKKTDGALVPLQEWVDKFSFVAGHLLVHCISLLSLEL